MHPRCPVSTQSVVRLIRRLLVMDRILECAAPIQTRWRDDVVAAVLLLVVPVVATTMRIVSCQVESLHIYIMRVIVYICMYDL